MTIDELTGLYDRRGLNQYLQHEAARTTRSRSAFSLLMIDVDHFKDVNDNLGHLRGDRVLTEITAIIRSNCRQMDIPCRYGGDEFVIILPETKRDESRVLATRILDKIQEHLFRGYDDQPDIHLTVSIGIAEYSPDIASLEHFLEKADKALYLAKNSGRNRISLDSEVILKAAKPELNFKSFVNRQESLNILKEKFNIVLAGEAHLVVISGEAGIGKTRLVVELKKYCGLHRTVFLSSRPFEFGVTPPFQIFFDPIRAFIRLDEHKHLKLLSGLPTIYKEVLAQFMPEMRLAMDSIDSAEKLPPDQEKIRLFEAVYLVLEVISKESPLLLFLDDLQWVRDADLELLGYLLRSSKHLSILFCGAFRIEEADENHPIRRFLQAIRREHHYQPIELSGLIFEDVRELLQKILGFTVSEEWNRRIFEESGGNPFYIEEIVKSMVDSGNIYWDKNRWSFHDITEIQLPGSVSDLIRRRLDEIDSELKELLIQASAIGPRFSLKLLRELTGKNEGHLFDLLDSGIRLLLINPERDDIFSFSNILVQRTLYSDISPLKRRRYHLQIAQAIEKVYKDQVSDYWETLARHYRVAEDWDKVFTFTFKAAHKLKELYANQDAISCFGECLRLMAENHLQLPQAEAEIYKNLGDIYFLIGKYRESIESLDSMQKLPDLTDRDKTGVKMLLGKVYARLGDFDRALACFAEAKKGLDAEAQKVDIAELEIQALWIHAKRGEYETVRQLAEKTLAVLQGTANDLNIGFVYNILGNIAQEKGDLVRAEEYHQESLRYRVKTGALDEIARGYNNIGEVAQIKGQLEFAIENFEKGLDLKIKSGERFGISYMSTSLGLALTEVGQFDRARQHLDESLNIASSINSEFLLTYASMAQALLHLRRADYRKAIEYGNQALAIARQIGEVFRLVESLNILAQASLKLDQAHRAREMLVEAEQTCRQYGCKYLLAHSLLLMALIDLKTGQWPSALPRIEEAAAINQSIGSLQLEAEGALLRARIQAEQGDKRSHDAFSTALGHAETLKDPCFMAEVLLYSALALDALGKRDEAVKQLTAGQEKVRLPGDHPLLEQINKFIREA